MQSPTIEDWISNKLRQARMLLANYERIQEAGVVPEPPKEFVTCKNEVQDDVLYFSELQKKYPVK